MEHFRPHSPPPSFEGYYSKFDLPSGAYIALIICSVPKSTRKPHMVHFTYVPPDFPRIPVFQREIWADDIQMISNHASTGTNATTSDNTTDSRVSVKLIVPGVGEMTVADDSTTTYSIRDPDGQFTFTSTVHGRTRVPWSRDDNDSTPEGLLVRLPLPLHWHVHSLASDCTFHLEIPSNIYPHVHPTDQSAHPTSAKVHQEKNWAHSFPSSHIWIQCRNSNTKSGLNIAGGSIIGMEAYLLSYHARNPKHDISFTPPYSMAPSFFPNISRTMTVSHTWSNRSIDLRISGLTRKIEVHAQAPAGTFFGVSAPFAEGHRDNFLGQSFRAKVHVKVYEAGRFGLGHWSLVCEEDFENASLEFGGDAYEDENKGREKSENGGQA